MKERYDFNNPDNSGYKPPRKKGRFITYIALVLVTSLISSITVGGILYNKFSNDLGSMKLAVLSSTTPANQVAKENDQSVQSSGQSESNSASGVTAVSMDKLVQTALSKGSDVTAIAKKIGPSIVGIRMTVNSTRRSYFGASGSQTAEGSGIILSKDGYIMTNYHVVSNADPKSGTSSNTVLEVFLPDGSNAKAVFKGGDSKTDLAVIKVDLKNLPAAELGDSSKLEVGELAVAIGNPLGMEFAGSVTVGVVSALNRTVEMDDKTMNLIQTDAAINAGNSGGALVNSQGQVIGINSVKISASGVEGLGFAIPINDAKPIVDQLMMYGYVKGRVAIGISPVEITDTMSSWYNIPKGIYVQEVTAGSGASKAGIQQGDIITSIAGKTVETINDLDKLLEGYKPGNTVTVTIVRDNVKMSLKLTFDELK
jgi:serine protease Do